jgi:hypothetical protein
MPGPESILDGETMTIPKCRVRGWVLGKGHQVSFPPARGFGVAVSLLSEFGGRLKRQPQTHFGEFPDKLFDSDM